MKLTIDLPRSNADSIVEGSDPATYQDLDLEASADAFDEAVFAIARECSPDAEIQFSERGFRVYGEEGNEDTDETRAAVDIISWEAERLYNAGGFWVERV